MANAGLKNSATQAAITQSLKFNILEFKKTPDSLIDQRILRRLQACEDED